VGRPRTPLRFVVVAVRGGYDTASTRVFGTYTTRERAEARARVLQEPIRGHRVGSDGPEEPYLPEAEWLVCVVRIEPL
jgi:hypothetical protein